MVSRGAPARQVEYATLRSAAHRGGVEQQQIGGEAFPYPAAVGDAEYRSRLGGEPAHGFAQRHRAHVAHPVTEQVQTEARIVEEGQVRPGIAQAHQAVRVVEHATDGIFVGVEQLGREHGLQVLRETQVQHDVERITRLVACDVGDAPLLVASVVPKRGFDDLDLVPLTVEQPEGRGRRQLGAQPGAKRRIREHFS